MNAYREAHLKADTDQTAQSIHHTIGDGPTQAGSGKKLADLEKQVALLSATIAMGYLGEIKVMTHDNLPPVGPFGEEWVIAAGQAVSRADYSDYFDIIGTSAGVGDGSTTFNVPNLTGESFISLDALARFTSEGANSRTLDVSNMPEHSHNMEHHHNMDHGHSAFASANTGAGGRVARGATLASPIELPGGVKDFSGNTGSSSEANTGTSGSGAAFDNRPKSIQLVPWLRIK